MINLFLRPHILLVLASVNAAILAMPQLDPRISQKYDSCCDMPTFLNLYKLCADKIKAECIQADDISSNKVSSDMIVTNTVCGKMVNAEALRSNMIETLSLCAAQAQIRNLCTDILTTNSLCVTDNFEFCTKFRANISDHAATTLYTLGAPILFDTIDDDPNSNVTQSLFTSYTVPRSGYYVLTLNLPFQNLQGPLVTGAPTALPAIRINGITQISVGQTFLAFSLSQDASLTALIMLNAGDVLSVEMTVKVFDPVLGLINYPGTVSLLGGANQKPVNFSIHFLSGTCATVACPSQCQISCQPTPVACPPVSDCSCSYRSAHPIT